jgi:hypothetical protein
MAEESIPKAPPPPKESIPKTEKPTSHTQLVKDIGTSLTPGNMTMVPVVLIGVGVIFIASALDGTPIIQTIQKILTGQAINWAGTNPSTSSTTSKTTPPPTKVPPTFPS